MTRRRLIVMPEFLDEDRQRRIEEKLEPSFDFYEAAKRWDADLLTYDKLSLKEPKRSVTKYYAMSQLAYEAWKQSPRYETVLTTGEDLAIPMAMLNTTLGKRARLVTIAHYLNPRKKSAFLQFQRFGAAIDRLITYSPEQARFAESQLQFPKERISVIPFHADTHFYHPSETEKRDPKLIVSAGMERRDYQTLFQSLDGLDFQLELGIGSPWSRFRLKKMDIPSYAKNAFRSRLELRSLFQRAGAVVLPLIDTPFQAGISIMLEAAACGAPLIVTKTQGLRHVFQASKDALLVPAKDSNALREAILKLSNKRELAESLGQNARQKVKSSMSTEHFIDRLNVLCS